MKIAVAADTHGRIEGLKKQLIIEKPDHLFFAGDFLSDSRRLAKHLDIATDAVLGNCDGQTAGEWEKVIELAGKRFYIVHGHQFGVKGSLNTLFYRGQELGADAVIFGHTHVACCEQVAGMWMLNPGSASRPRKGKMASYIMLQIEGPNMDPRLQFFIP
ncbi:MAG: metallophosphoesterase [Syntrophomonas sp.]